jgi:uncharacterized membrane protein YhhN
MTALAWGLLAVAGCFAVTDWWATWTERVAVRYVAKPATLVALIGVAVALHPFDGRVRAAMVAGLVLSLGGDVFLLLSEKWFIAGLATFLLGHIAYVVGLQLAPTSLPWSLVGLAVVAVAIATVGRRVVSGVAGGEHRSLAVPVIAYLVVISAMVVSAFGTQGGWAIGGAMLFYVSDATLAWNRFLEQRRFGPLGVMTTYHLGQAGLVVWLVWP